jgi:hypothetical protein
MVYPLMLYVIGGIRHIVKKTTETQTFFHCGSSTGLVDLIDLPPHSTPCRECLSQFCDKSVKSMLAEAPELRAFVGLTSNTLYWSRS